MDTETLQPLQTNEQQENQELLTPDIKIRKKGRPKTTKIIEDKEAHIKEYHKKRYQQQKDKIKERATESQKRYRNAYKLLIKMIEEKRDIPDDIRVEVIKIISV